MDVHADFESQILERIGRLESAVSALSRRVDGMPAPRPIPSAAARAPQKPVHLAPSRGADWWLARAGAALTLVALILLYQYAVGHGWITPAVRVMTGVAVGAGLMYWGRKLTPASDKAAAPVALRELMMGAGLGAWYVSAFAASASYHLISIPTARFIFLILSISGGFIALNERRALLAMIAIGTGFATPALLSSTSNSLPAYVLFLSVLGALSVYLYLMRGWQSILWISFFSMWGSIYGSIGLMRSADGPGATQPLFGFDRLSVTLLTLAMTYAFVRAPVMRRTLIATGSDRYPAPIRSPFAANWLGETGRFFTLFSTHAGQSDSLSAWVITLAAPLVGLSLLSHAWMLNGYASGLLAMFAAAIAFNRFDSSTEAHGEVKDIFGAAVIVWSLGGALSIGRSVAGFAVIDANAVSLSIVAIYSIVIVTLLSAPRFATPLAVGRLLAGIAVAAVLVPEVALFGSGAVRGALGPMQTVAEVLAIAAGILAALEMAKSIVKREVLVPFQLAVYGAFLLVDARVLGAIWLPIVTATYAIVGTALLIRGRGEQGKVMRRTGAATIALVIARLLFIDLVGVDTIWRVLLFLGCGALFLFASYWMQNVSTPPAPDAV